MIFELRDLKFATPATATRAGILYISEGRQWANMVSSWLDRVARPYAEKAKWKARPHRTRLAPRPCGGAHALLFSVGIASSPPATVPAS
jgi:hypothetical protein